MESNEEKPSFLQLRTSLKRAFSPEPIRGRVRESPTKCSLTCEINPVAALKGIDL